MKEGKDPLKCKDRGSVDDVNEARAKMMKL